MQVAAGVHRVTRGVVNWYLIEDGGRLALVDAGTPRDWRALVETVAALGRTLDDIEAVLLTHAHGDHTGFAERARTDARARVLVHESDAEGARTGKVGPRDGSIRDYLGRAEFYRTFISLVRRGAGRIVPIKVLTTFADGEVLDVPGRPRVIHAPGHTAGCCALLLEDRRLLFTGDTMVTHNPLTGRPGPQVMPSGFNADTPAALRSLDLLAGAPADTVLPGHGDPWRDGVAAAVDAARRAGRS